MCIPIDKFKLIRINIERRRDTKEIIKNILESCSLSTEYVDKIRSSPVARNANASGRNSGDSHYGMKSPFSDEYEIFNRIKKAKQEKTLRWDWH